MQILVDVPDEEYNMMLLKQKMNIGGIPSAAEEYIVQGKPLPKAEWVYREELFDDEDKPRMAYGCSRCGHSIKSVHEKRNFCPNCGAIMAEQKRQEYEDE